MTIRLKLFLSFLGVALIPLALLGVQFYYSAQNAFLGDIKERLVRLSAVQRDRLQFNEEAGLLNQDLVNRLTSVFSDFLGQTGETLMLASDGKGGATLQSPRRFGSAPPSSDIIAMTQMKTDGFKEDVIDSNGHHVFAASAYLPSKDWTVVVKMDRDEVLAPFYSLFSGPLLIGLIFIVMAVAFISLLVTESFLAPIRDLTEVTRAISLGNMQATIDPETLSAKDEIGDLGRAFDRTVVSLKLAMVDLDSETRIRKAAIKEPPKENPVI